MDADDVFLPGCFEGIRERLGDTDVVLNNIRFVDPAGEVFRQNEGSVQQFDERKPLAEAVRRGQLLCLPR
jgi:hypothetical protein